MKEALYRIEPFALGFLDSKYDDIEYRMASGFYALARYMPLDIEEGRLFAGMFHSVQESDEPIAVKFNAGQCIVVNEEKARKCILDHPEYRSELTNVFDEMRASCTNYAVHARQTARQRKILSCDVGWGGGQYTWSGGHSNPDYLLREGTNGVRRKIEKYRKINGGKDVFYDALLLCLDALDTYGARYREIALQKAEASTGEVRENYLRIAAALTQVPQNAPRDFFEACQSFWLVFCADGIDSPGRFDQCMIDYYRMSAEEDRLRSLEGLWQLFFETRTWNLCISGSDSEGNDQTNELSYDILRVARKYKYETPNLTMRVHENTPDALWDSALDTIGTGIGMPAIYNDACVVAALEGLGIPKKDAHEYCMNGCNQIDVFGKSHMGLEDGEVCLAKCLELALHNGRCGKCGEQVGEETGDATLFGSYDELWRAYKKQVECIIDEVVLMANKTQEFVARNAPNPHRSLLFAGCIEKGLDLKCGGTLYYNAQILAEGIADTVDSLAATKHFVFDTKKYTMAELIDALDKNFEGYDALYADFSGYDKFGNDLEHVDEIYRAVTDHFYTYLPTKRSYRGGVFSGGCSTFQRAARYGGSLAALPNGKKNGETLLADSIGATPGRDQKGVTALLNSVLCANQTRAGSGNVLQLKFGKKQFTTPEGKQNFLALAKVYFDSMGQQLTVNVLSREELLDAQKNPQNHSGLVVRVGGFSARFVELSRELQDNIIARTEIEI